MTPQDQASELYAKATEAKANGDLQTAYQLFTQCVQLNPNASCNHLALAIVASGIAQKTEPLREQAMLHAQQAAKLSPEILGNWIGLAEIALACNKFMEAIAAFEQAITMDPKDARLYGLCGFAYARMNYNDKAMDYYTKAVTIDPEMGDIHFLLSCQYAGDNFNPSKQAFHGERGFLAKRPAKLSVESCWNSAHGYLGCGDYKKGWQYFESRHNPNITNAGQLLASQRFPVPMWKGETVIAISDRETRPASVRIHTEHGLGDCFLMARYIPAAVATGVKVIFEVHPSMLDLMKFNFPDVEVVAYGAESSAFDYHLPMMSLPFVLKSKKPLWNGPYLKSDRRDVAEWHGRLCHDGKLDNMKAQGPVIGIVWAGGKRSYNAENNETNRRRSVPFDLIKPLLAIDGVTFLSLQVDEQEPFPNPGIKDFTDTAALITLCDVVISVDSSVANLAGAMGRNVWLLNRYDACWRWAFSAWYPTIKDFRQKQPRGWGDVIDRVELSIFQLRDKVASNGEKDAAE